MHIDHRLQTTLEQTQIDLAQAWPEVIPFVTASNESLAKPAQNKPTRLDVESKKISQEERLQLLDQLQAISALPPGQLDSTTAQELAQKLTYLLGHQVRFSQDDHQLTYTHGTIRAMNSSAKSEGLWPLDPTNTHRQKSAFLHADSSIWVSPKDFVGSQRTDWKEPWFLHQTLLVINPLSKRAVVSSITGILTDGLNRYQFGGSRSLLQAGQFWAPHNQGQCIVCFLDESLKPGTVINLLTAGSFS